MADFLLELLSEEIPARMQAKAADELRAGFVAALGARGLAAGTVEAHVTPRRLALLARGLPDATEAAREERRGPRADAAAGAIAGFARGAGVAADALVARDDAKGRFLYAVIERPGRAAAEVLADAVTEAVDALAWPKSMRWGVASAAMDSPRWVRPLTGVVALLDDAVVPLTVLGVAAGRTTYGHRFMSAGEIVVERPATYAARLRAAFVMLDADERRRVIGEGARAAAAAAGLALIEDEGLIAENAGLTEWPVPLLGRFDPAFLGVPREVIQLTMRVNQKYFACTEAVARTEAGFLTAHPQSGALASAFVCVANLAAFDGGAAIVEGNRRVLAARLSDARFFWEQDLKLGLDAMTERLGRVVFHEKLGTMADKAERVARLARWLVESGAVSSKPVTPGLSRGPASSSPTGSAEGSWVPGQARDDGAERDRLADMAERAGRLAKADLTSAMVGEFPELQGVMGGYYARAAGEAEAVAYALRNLYETGGPSRGWSIGPVAHATALADRADTLRHFFEIGEAPTGSRDPFALRRAALQSATLIFRGQIRVSGRHLFGAEAFDYVLDRYKHQLTGGRHDVVNAVLAIAATDDDLYRIGHRYRALSDLIATPDGQNLLAGYRRAANILAIEAKRDGVERFDPVAGDEVALTPADRALADVLGPVAEAARAAVDAEDFGGAMAALARLRGPIDAFFEGVMVNEAGMRAARLAMLQRFVDAVHGVADFSKVEG